MELLAPPEALYARVYVDLAVRPLFFFSLKRKEKDERERGHRKRNEERERGKTGHKRNTYQRREQET